eukprot:TRINITY_DN1322_c0_g1_i1.p1 TRINITY_DN1322_c0_g1~~TRINITY_DN1322_c0_g1_i1.p1  ORF type:complete len:556 (+),score=155.87 TRINITY_DN1322_c0_g1_i1:59-1726(+)
MRYYCGLYSYHFIIYVITRILLYFFFFFFFQAEDGIRDAQESRGLGDVYKRQGINAEYGGNKLLSMAQHLPLQSTSVKYDKLSEDPTEGPVASRPCRDIVFALSFLAGVGAMVASVSMNVPALTQAFDHSSVKQDLYTHTETVQALAFAFAAAVLFAVIWLVFMRFCVRCAVYCTYIMVLTVEVAGTVGLFYLARDTTSSTPQRLLYSLGVIACLLVLYTLYQGYKLKSRVDLCATMVRISGHVLVSSPALLLVALGLVCLKFGYAILCTASMWVLHQSDMEHKGWVTLCLVLMAFWGLAVMSNLVLVTIYGCLGRWYHSQEGGTFKSLGRACTTSLGSVCFGSLVVASIQTAHTGCQTLQKKGWIPRYLMCVLDYVFNALEAAVESCNTYGFVQVAVKGTSFVESSKRAMTFLKYRGLTALLSESILSRLQALGSFAAAILCGLVAVGSCKYVLHVTLSDHERTTLLAAAATLGWFVVYALIAPLHSLATALLVCFAESPEVMANSHADQYNLLVDSWKQVYGEEFVDKAATLAHDEDLMCKNAEPEIKETDMA